MPRNVEIKAKLGTKERFDQVCARAEAISDQPMKVLEQYDTFFHCEDGRLKLRVLMDSGVGHLIYYQRGDQGGPKQSVYNIYVTDDPLRLETVLKNALGATGEVQKTRQLYMVGQTRIHLDTVKGLEGYFMELEVVLTQEQTEEEGQAIATDLMQKLGIRKEDLLEGAYMDLLRTTSSDVPKTEKHVLEQQQDHVSSNKKQRT